MINSPHSPLNRSPRILLVDDNHYGNAGRKTLLEQRGYDVDTSTSGVR